MNSKQRVGSLIDIVRKDIFTSSANPIDKLAPTLPALEKYALRSTYQSDYGRVQCDDPLAMIPTAATWG